MGGEVGGGQRSDARLIARCGEGGGDLFGSQIQAAIKLGKLGGGQGAGLLSALAGLQPGTQIDVGGGCQAGQDGRPGSGDKPVRDGRLRGHQQGESQRRRWARRQVAGRSPIEFGSQRKKCRVIDILLTQQLNAKGGKIRLTAMA